MPEELELIARASCGDGAAFEGIFGLHGPALYRIAHAILGNAEDAEDALQEVIMRTFLRFDRYDPRRPLLPWLRRLMVNECLSRLRRRKREQRALSEVAGPAPSHPDSTFEMAWRVHEALAKLPPGQRIAITLVGLDGMDLEATARAMGCSTGAVKSHLHRARTKLKAELREVLPLEAETT